MWLVKHNQNFIIQNTYFWAAFNDTVRRLKPCKRQIAATAGYGVDLIEIDLPDVSVARQKRGSVDEVVLRTSGEALYVRH